MKKHKVRVAVAIAGGLGNQLFQYAAVRAYSEANKCELILDISAFKNDKLFGRKFLLNQFKIVTCKQIDFSKWSIPNIKVKGWSRVRNFILSIQEFLVFGIHTKYIEIILYNNYEQEKREFKAGHPFIKYCEFPKCEKWKTLYLNGYWQSEDYFKDYTDLIKKELQPKLELPNNKKIELEKINSSESVVIGVRRYNENEVASSVHFKLGADYYKKAIEMIKEKVNSPKFFIFTMPSDIEWAKEHFKNLIDNYEIIKPAETNNSAWQDLELMKNCKHFIISNSTYHWWGAWLSMNKQKVVIAPKLGWANDNAIPKEWIRI